MQNLSIKILSTKLLASGLINQAAIDNIEIDCCGFIETRPVDDIRLRNQIKFYSGKKITALFTSVNAVNAVFSPIDTKPPWQVFCISGKTKTALLQHLDEDAILATAPDALTLAKKIMTEKYLNDCVFFCGNKRTPAIPDAFLSNGVSLEEVVVYETIATPKKINRHYNGILFFSPSAVESFFSINKTAPKTVLFSVGKTTAKTIKKFTDNPIITAGFPSFENMLSTVRNYFISGL